MIVASYTDEHGLHEVSGASLADLTEALDEADYDGPRLAAYEGETLRGWVGADGFAWVAS